MRALTILALLGGCAEGTFVPEMADMPSPLLTVAEAERWSMPGLSKPVYVVYTDAGVPRVYAHDRADLMRAYGFVLARDRWFQLDLVRRLAKGTVSELLGDVGLESDLESRMISMTHATDSLYAALDSDQQRLFGAFADGFNAYRDEVIAGELPLPSEYALAGPLIGEEDPAALLTPWDVRDVAGIGGAILFRLGYETGDIGRHADIARLEGLYATAPLGELRQAGAWQVLADVAPLFDVASAPDGWGQSGSRPRGASDRDPPVLQSVESTMLERARDRFDRYQSRMGRDHENGWGSNAWAVAGSSSADGRALFASDGHLELDIPALMYQVGLDTAHLGGGSEEQVGLALVGMPILSVGTNGSVAWSTTQFSGDITDWYAEQLFLGEDGLPIATLFKGDEKPVEAHEEVFEIADIPLLGSVGRTEVWSRYTTWDGKWITDIEGTEVGCDADGPIVNLVGTCVTPGDVDGNGVVDAIAFDFTGLDGGNLFGLFDAIGHADDVVGVHEAMRKANALSQNLIAADTRGDVYYSGYEMVPCRGYLPRDGSGAFVDGADPTRLIDGTVHGSFTIPIGPDGVVDESQGSDPARCVVPFDDYPHAFTPSQGYLLSGNNDPAGGTFDGDFWNEPYHIGGPWNEAYRANRIDELLREATADGATLDDMSRIQGDHQSQVGRAMAPLMLAAAERVRLSTGETPAASRAQDLYRLNADRVDEAVERLAEWVDAGTPARSGVETFYSVPEPDDADHAVATMIFNTWLGDLNRDALDDEGLPGAVFVGGGTSGRLRLLAKMFDGTGPDDPEAMAHWNPATGESAFWDVLSTEEIESQDEVVVGALVHALDFLSSEPTGEAEGGFGTSEMQAWVWGLRHQAEFRSLVSSYIDDPLFTPIFEPYSITTDRLPLAEGLLADDPRKELTWFPRHGDNRAIDASNNGLSGRSFRYGSGPVMRMVFALGPDGVEGRNVIPGGQSGLIDDPYSDDQAALWLANETVAVPWTPAEVASAGITRTTFVPK
jgi:penicillin amidase